MIPARLAGLAVAGLLALPPAAAADCAPGYEAIDILAVNLAGAPVAVSVRQARSDDPWQSLALEPGEKAVVPVCLQMVLSVAAAEFGITDPDGTERCAGSAMIPAGAEATLVAEPDGVCALRTSR